MSDAPHHENRVLVEQTSKAIKLRILICNIAAGVGFVGMLSTKAWAIWAPSAALFFGAIGYWCWMKFQKWWQHG